MELTDRVAIITGAGRGIGRAIAGKLARNGAIIAVVDRSPGRASESSAELNKSGFKAVAISTDVTRKAEVDDMVKRVLSDFGHIDILVNNAGWVKWQLFRENDPALWDQFIDLNLKGVIYCTRAVLDHMVERKRGKIVNIASDAGRCGMLGQAVYGAAKAGVIGFTRCMAGEAAQYNININCVSPGIVETPLIMAGLTQLPDAAKNLQAMAQSIPLGRIAKPEDIAEAVFFFASSASDYITGQVLSVNGGALMP